MINFRNNKKKRVIAGILIAILIAAMVIPLCMSVLYASAEGEDASAAETENASAQVGTQDETAAAGETAADQTAGQTAADPSAAATAAGQGGIDHPDRVIQSGITIGGVDVGGMTEAAAEQKLRDTFAGYGKAVITLTGSEGSGQDPVEVTADQLGLSWTDHSAVEKAGSYGHGPNLIARYKEKKDLEQNGAEIAADLGFRREDIVSVLENQCASFNQEAVDAGLTRENGQFVVHEGTPGTVIDETASADKILSVLSDDWKGQNLTIALDMKTEQPQGSAQELADVKDLLGTFTTSYPNSGEARCTNIANACGFINGTVVYPGQEFSVLKTITPFTAENGYELAGSYLGSQVVDSFGGGICQVSTTLYNAVIRAELQVDERHNHSLVVGYVDLSDDAAIAESSGMDFKFTNTLDCPVYLEGTISGKSITFNIYGKETRDPGRKVSFESETLETVEPEGEAVYTDSTQPVGTITYTAAHTGYRAQLWKVVTENGKEVSREVFNHSTYNMAPKSCTVGTLGTMTQALQAAVSSQSISAVETALANIETDKAGEAVLAALQAQAETAAKNAYAQAIASGADEAAAQAAAQQASQAVAAAAAGQSAAAQTPAAPADQTAAQQASQTAPDAGGAGQTDGSAAGAVDNGAGQTDPAGSAPDAQAVPQQGDAAGAASPTDSGAPAQ